ncbi:hypothetical protein JZX76_11430 [Haloarcula hispanica]|uniref:hypothetical protein n=1 Tax=Haloarcula hispanica TaxID=51589 RepID=UPI001A90E8DE|nr:hypothetical protein [Haloarcula hispanica]MCJ0620098.1 hypothetical protein [Haloarcula hispanica]
MEQLDERIMEFIYFEGWASPNLLEKERSVSASEDRIRDRCKFLHYVGFIEPIHGEMYDLTSEGILYLKGEIDAEHYPDPTPSKVFKDRFATPSNWAHASMKPYWP